MMSQFVHGFDDGDTDSDESSQMSDGYINDLYYFDQISQPSSVADSETAPADTHEGPNQTIQLDSDSDAEETTPNSEPVASQSSTDNSGSSQSNESNNSDLCRCKVFFSEDEVKNLVEMGKLQIKGLSTPLMDYQVNNILQSVLLLHISNTECRDAANRGMGNSSALLREWTLSFNKIDDPNRPFKRFRSQVIINAQEANAVPNQPFKRFRSEVIINAQEAEAAPNQPFKRFRSEVMNNAQEADAVPEGNVQTNSVPQENPVSNGNLQLQDVRPSPTKPIEDTDRDESSDDEFIEIIPYVKPEPEIIIISDDEEDDKDSDSDEEDDDDDAID